MIIKSFVKLAIDSTLVAISIISDSFYNTAVMNGAGAGSLAAVGFLGMGLLTDFEAGSCVFGAMALPFVGGLLRAIVYGDTPVWNYFDKRWFSKSDPEYIEDITPFLMGDHEDEVIDLEQPFQMGDTDEMERAKRYYFSSN